MHTLIAPEPHRPPEIPITSAELSPAALAALDAIAASLWAWSSRDRLIAAGHATETLDDLVAAGWAVGWDIPIDVVEPEPAADAVEGSPNAAPAGPCVCLSCQATGRLGVEIIEEGICERPRYGKGTCPEEGGTILPNWGKLREAPAVVLAPKFVAELRLPRFLVSREGDPAAQAEANEIAELSRKVVTVHVRDEITDEPLYNDDGTAVMASVLLRGHAIPVDGRLQGKGAPRESKPCRRPA